MKPDALGAVKRGQTWLDQRARTGGKRLVRRRASEVTPRPVDWLWPGRIARGKVSLLAGHPGLGKSQITAALAAVVTRGGRWPVDATQAERGRVVMLSAEDDVHDTIVPRLMAAGADLDQVELIEATEDDTRRTVDVVRDLPAVEAMLAELQDVALLVVDPITAYLGRIDTHRASDVRAALAPLAATAMRHNVAVVCVSHLRKDPGSGALMQISGSAAFVAAARATYVVAKDPADERRRLLLPVKNNLGDDATGFAYRIEPAVVGQGIETSRVSWEAEEVTVSADEALAPAADDAARGEREEAAAWLRDMLAEGAMRVDEIKRMATEAGFAWRTVERAKHSLGLRVSRDGFRGPCRWRLNDAPVPAAPGSRHLPNPGGHDGPTAGPIVDLEL